MVADADYYMYVDEVWNFRINIGENISYYEFPQETLPIRRNVVLLRHDILSRGKMAIAGAGGVALLCFALLL